MEVEIEVRQQKPRTPKITSKPPAARAEAGAHSLPRPWEGANPEKTLVLDLYPPELWDSKILLFKPAQFMVFVMAALAN